jgi:hypothetical protein
MISRASGSQGQSRSSPGFDPSIHPPTQWNLRGGNEAVLNNKHKKTINANTEAQSCSRKRIPYMDLVSRI